MNSLVLAAALASQPASADFVYSAVEPAAMVFRTMSLAELKKPVVEYRLPLGDLEEPEGRIIVEDDLWTRYVGYTDDSLLYQTVYPWASGTWSYKDAYATAEGEEPATYATITSTGRELIYLSVPYGTQRDRLSRRIWDWDNQAWQDLKPALPVEIGDVEAHYLSDPSEDQFQKFVSDRTMIVGHYSFVWQNTPFLEEGRAPIYMQGRRVGFIGSGRIFVKDGDRTWRITPPENAFAVYDLDVKGDHLLCSFLFRPRLVRRGAFRSDWDSPLMYRGRIYLYTLEDNKMISRELFDGYACRFFNKPFAAESTPIPKA